MIHGGYTSRNTERTDSLGTYTAYHRLCQYRGCGTELTSRNRHQQYLLCKPCARAKDRDRFYLKGRTPAEAALARAKKEDPMRQKAHHLLEQFLNHPRNADIKAGLVSYLTTIEIAHFMSRLPNLPTKEMNP